MISIHFDVCFLLMGCRLYCCSPLKISARYAYDFEILLVYISYSLTKLSTSMFMS
jgi:hypothetical protein